MADVKELKELIVDLKMQIVRRSIPHGNCPYAMYPHVEKLKEDENCDDCVGCTCRFFAQYEAQVREEVEAL